MLKVTLAQLNYMVGDISGNIRRMREAATRAAAEQADLVVFSELSLCGYYPGDLLDEPSCCRPLASSPICTGSWAHPRATTAPANRCTTACWC